MDHLLDRPGEQSGAGPGIEARWSPVNGWWLIAALVAVAGPLVIHLTAQPWARCRPCEGIGTRRNPWTGKWLRHCPDCGGYGWIERPARRAIRDATGGRLFPRPPEKPGDVLYAGNEPFRGGGRRRKRRRTRTR